MKKVIRFENADVVAGLCSIDFNVLASYKFENVSPFTFSEQGAVGIGHNELYKMIENAETVIENMDFKNKPQFVATLYMTSNMIIEVWKKKDALL